MSIPTDYWTTFINIDAADIGGGQDYSTPQIPFGRSQQDHSTSQMLFGRLSHDYSVLQAPFGRL